MIEYRITIRVGGVHGLVYAIMASNVGYAIKQAVERYVRNHGMPRNWRSMSITVTR